jgi:HK97 family phage portal protein
MGLLTSIVKGQPESRASLAHLDSWLKQIFGGPETASGIKMDEATALKFSAVYACVRILSETLASLPLPVYRLLSPRGKQPDTSHHLYKVLHDQPNPEMTSHVVLWGNAHAEIERDRAKRVIVLWPLLPDRT